MNNINDKVMKLEYEELFFVLRHKGNIILKTLNSLEMALKVDEYEKSGYKVISDNDFIFLDLPCL